MATSGATVNLPAADQLLKPVASPSTDCKPHGTCCVLGCLWANFRVTNLYTFIFTLLAFYVRIDEEDAFSRFGIFLLLLAFVYSPQDLYNNNNNNNSSSSSSNTPVLLQLMPLINVFCGY